MQIGPAGLGAAAAPVTPPPAGTPGYVEPTRELMLARWASLWFCTCLIVLCLAWELVLAPTGRGTLAVKALPLVLALPGLWRWRLYTSRWLSLAVWLYVIEGLVRGWSDRGIGQLLGMVEVLLAVALFVACAVQVRWRLRAGRLAQASKALQTPVEVPAGVSVDRPGDTPAGH
jgi:uncharacterized membrane protein